MEDNEKLEIRVAELTAELSVARQQLETVEEELRKTLEREKELHDALESEKNLNELKFCFISCFSHDIRAPLASIASSAEILERYDHKFTEEKKRTYLRRLQKAVNSITIRLNNLLLFWIVEDGKLKFNPAPIDLEQFCLSLVEKLKYYDRSQHDITFINHTQDLKACMDESLLRDILQNVLLHAINHSPTDGKVRLNLECVGSTVQFCIQNERVWESYNQASNMSWIFSQYGAWDVVKKCVDLHEGQITVESAENVGTKFTVTLPLNRKSA
jgi:signal transduction histidine kinase